MPPRKTQPNTHRHPKLAPRPSPSSNLAAVPTQTPTPYIPLPTSLTQKINTLIQISRQVESLARFTSYGLFSTATEQRDAHHRMAYLREKYFALREHVERELATTGYRPANLDIPFLPGSNQRHIAGSYGHKYGPKSPKYTVDKALKRKADSPSAEAGRKKRKTSVESDYCESESDNERKKEEASWGAVDPVTNLAMIPLGKGESERMREWGWRAAWGRGGVKEEEVVSPLGTRVCW